MYLRYDRPLEYCTAGLIHMMPHMLLVNATDCTRQTQIYWPAALRCRAVEGKIFHSLCRAGAGFAVYQRVSFFVLGRARRWCLAILLHIFDQSAVSKIVAHSAVLMSNRWYGHQKERDVTFPYHPACFPSLATCRD